MVLAHAGALALVPASILAGGRAFFLLPVGLNDIDLPKAFQGALNEIVEPSARQFPVTAVAMPCGNTAPPVPKPVPVIDRPRQAHTQRLPLAGTPQDHRNRLLTPDLLYPAPVHHCASSLMAIHRTGLSVELDAVDNIIYLK